ncbi:hypothetical protein HNR46_001846 [Haloferula luteola]|uniref:Uncharacterized protein n=1 Tax=Haloferula luteola TaxID=595692 RepID=A0A840VCS2_9BACT|nr:hypothetical protein [Haloferula luteola]MBB5351609.1 hypothetical protein [Haloferula luteola]
MKALIIASLLSLTLGLLIGRWTGPAAISSSPSTPADELPSSNLAREKAPHSKVPQLRSLLASDTIDQEAFRQAMEAWDPADYPEIIGWLADQGGLLGLDFQKKSYLKHLIQRWYAQNSDAALAWIASQASPDDRQFYHQAIVEGLGLQDLPAAVAFWEAHYDRSARFQPFSYDLFSLAAQHSPEMLIRLCQASASRHQGPTGNPIDFPEGFDFRSCMDGFASAATSLDEDQKLTMIPPNLIYQWSLVAPQEALEWALETEGAGWTEKLHYFEPLTQFFQGLAQTSDTVGYGDFLADFYRARSDTDASAERIFNALSQKPDSETLDTFLGSVSRDANADEVIRQILPASLQTTGPSAGGLRQELFVRLSPEAQRAFLREISAQSTRPIGFNELLKSLPSLGYSEEEIHQAVGP